MGAEPIFIVDRKIGGRDIEYGYRTDLSACVEAVYGACISGDNGARKLGVRFKLQAVFYRVVIFAIHSGNARTDDESAVRQGGVVACHFFGADEMYCRVVVGKVVRHRDDLMLDTGLVGAVLGDDEAFTKVLLSC